MFTSTQPSTDRIVRHPISGFTVIPALVFALTACAGDSSADVSDSAGATAASVNTDTSAARMTVELFGQHMKDVALLAPDSLVTKQIQDAYGSLVTPELLRHWQENPSDAPGRDVSSPWPERIEIREITPTGSGEVSASGDVVYVTSTEQSGGAAARQPVNITVLETEPNTWRISAFQQSAAADSSGASNTAR